MFGTNEIRIKDRYNTKDNSVYIHLKNVQYFSTLRSYNTFNDAHKQLTSIVPNKTVIFP